MNRKWKSGRRMNSFHDVNERETRTNERNESMSIWCRWEEPNRFAIIIVEVQQWTVTSVHSTSFACLQFSFNSVYGIPMLLDIQRMTIELAVAYFRVLDAFSKSATCCRFKEVIFICWKCAVLKVFSTKEHWNVALDAYTMRVLGYCLPNLLLDRKMWSERSKQPWYFFRSKITLMQQLLKSFEHFSGVMLIFCHRKMPKLFQSHRSFHKFMVNTKFIMTWIIAIQLLVFFKSC